MMHIHHTLATEHEVVWNLIDDERGVLRGYIRICRWPEPLNWILTDVVVNSSHQGQGFGSELLRTALAWADKHKLGLNVLVAPEGGWMDLEEVVEWYERHGFVSKADRSMHRPSNDERDANV